MFKWWVREDYVDTGYALRATWVVGHVLLIDMVPD